MKKIKIAIDLDDVLAAHAEAFIKFSNKSYGTSLTVEDYSDHWADLWSVEHDEIERRASEFHIPEGVAAFSVKQESISALKQLSDHHLLYVVTARSQVLIGTTRNWLDKYFPKVFQDIHFVPIWEPNNTITKADICKKIGADYLIDDLPRHCNLVAEAGLRAILFGNYAWNRYEKIVAGVTRCRDWEAVLAHFESM